MHLSECLDLRSRWRKCYSLFLRWGRVFSYLDTDSRSKFRLLRMGSSSLLQWGTDSNNGINRLTCWICCFGGYRLELVALVHFHRCAVVFTHRSHGAYLCSQFQLQFLGENVGSPCYAMIISFVKCMERFWASPSCVCQDSSPSTTLLIIYESVVETEKKKKRKKEEIYVLKMGSVCDFVWFLLFSFVNAHVFNPILSAEYLIQTVWNSCFLWSLNRITRPFV